MTDKNKYTFIQVMRKNDLSSVQNFIGDSLFKTLIQFASVIITSIYLIEINWTLYIVTFMVIPPGLFMIDRISKPMKKYFKEASKNLGKANSIAQDSYGGIPIIKAFNLEELFQNKFNENIKNGLKYNIQGVHRLKYIPSIAWCKQVESEWIMKISLILKEEF